LNEFDIYDFDIYQLDGGVGFYHDSRIIKQISAQKKTIVANYLGSDLRTRGIIPDINAISSCNFTFEYDHLELFPGINLVPFPFDFSEFKYQGEPEKSPIIIGHAPSNRASKGSSIIIESLKDLKTSHSFELQIIENMSHKKALEMKRNCNLFIDQISDIGYGLNAVEAMGMGIPTFSSLTKEFQQRYPDSPLIDISAENINEKLIPFVESAELRKRHGVKSKEWVVDFHDSVIVVKKILDILFKQVPGLTQNK